MDHLFVSAAPAIVPGCDATPVTSTASVVALAREGLVQPFGDAVNATTSNPRKKKKAGEGTSHRRAFAVAAPQVPVEEERSAEEINIPPLGV